MRHFDVVDDYKTKVLASMQELLDKAKAGAAGESDALHNGWGVREHEVYVRAMQDAISIVETGE